MPGMPDGRMMEARWNGSVEDDVLRAAARLARPAPSDDGAFSDRLLPGGAVHRHRRAQAAGFAKRRPVPGGGRGNLRAVRGSCGLAERRDELRHPRLHADIPPLAWAWRSGSARWPRVWAWQAALGGSRRGHDRRADAHDHRDRRAGLSGRRCDARHGPHEVVGERMQQGHDMSAMKAAHMMRQALLMLALNLGLSLRDHVFGDVRDDLELGEFIQNVNFFYMALVMWAPMAIVMLRRWEACIGTRS